MRLIIKSVLFIGIFVGIVSCASIPASTATLSQQVIEEADAMHKLNLALIQQLFDERKNKIDDFINNQYIPAFTKNFQAKIPAGVDVSADLPNILKSVLPVINKKRDSLHNIIDTERNQMIASLNTSYTSYQQASSTLQNLITSAVKLKASEATALAQVQNLTKTNINIPKIQHHLDSLLIKTGDGFNKLLNIKSAINGN